MPTNQNSATSNYPVGSTSLESDFALFLQTIYTKNLAKNKATNPAENKVDRQRE
jgi:hypothetical protein